jgi:hypothetical protein
MDGMEALQIRSWHGKLGSMLGEGLKMHASFLREYSFMGR